MIKMKHTLTALLLASLPLLSQAQTTTFPCWTAHGESFRLANEKTILEIPDTVAAIDLRGAGAITVNCASANPNCLYYTDGESPIEGLPAANVVSDGICDGLLLTDEASFYCPMPFTATDAMLRLTPRWDDDGDGRIFSIPCHETVMLPFDADLVIPADVNGPMPSGWFHAASYKECIDDLLIFSPADADHLNAYTPYLVEFAYGALGTQILFCGQNKTVEKTRPGMTAGALFNFIGTTASVDEALGYFRYHRGLEPCFILTRSNLPLEPFRCLIVASDIDKSINSGTNEIGESSNGSEQMLRYVIAREEEAESTGIEPRSQHRLSEKCYDLQGRPVTSTTHRGIYISGGVKVIR